MTGSAESRGPIRIRFRRSGGIAGLERELTIDTARLPPADRQEVEALVEASGYFDLPPSAWRGLFRGVATTPVLDVVRYEIDITRGVEHRRLTTDELTMPSKLQPLVSCLSRFEPTGRGSDEKRD